MSRVKTFDSTGLATSGRIYAGDLNSIQDQYADLYNLSQAHGVGSIALGEAGLQIVRYGPGEVRISGALRADGIVRALGGLYGGAFTTTQRDAIASGLAPTGLIILNTTTARLEINMGTDASRAWTGLDSVIASGTLGARPSATNSNKNTFYFATDDNGGTMYFSTGSAWTKQGRGLTEAISAGMIANGLITDAMLAGSITPSKISGTAVVNADSRLSDQRVPTANSVDFSKMASGNRTWIQSTMPAKVAGDRWIYVSGSSSFHFVCDGTYWWCIGGTAAYGIINLEEDPGVWNTWVNLPTFGPSATVPFAGDWRFTIGAMVNSNGGSGYQEAAIGLSRSAVGLTPPGLTSFHGIVGDGSNSMWRPLPDVMVDFIGLPASDTIQATYRLLGVGSGARARFDKRRISMMPIRVL